MSIDYATPQSQLNAILNGGSLNQAQRSEAGAISQALSAAIASYASTATDSPGNTSPYAKAVTAWAATAQGVFLELDRVARLVAVKVGLTPATITAFAVSAVGVPPTPLAWDAQLSQLGALNARVGAATTLATGTIYAGLLATASAQWATQLVSRPAPNAAADAASATVTAALQSAITTATTFVSTATSFT